MNGGPRSGYTTSPLPVTGLGFFFEAVCFFFFNDTATTEIYTLSLHDALPISLRWLLMIRPLRMRRHSTGLRPERRSEEHTSELQSQSNLVCRLLLEKKKVKAWRCGAVRYRRGLTVTR